MYADICLKVIGCINVRLGLCVGDLSFVLGKDFFVFCSCLNVGCVLFTYFMQVSAGCTSGDSIL